MLGNVRLSIFNDSMEDHKVIAIVDDDPDDLEMIGEVLCSIDPHLEIISLTSSISFLQKLDELESNYQPSILIIDYNMPFLNGGDVLDALNENDNYRCAVKIIMTTSDSTHFKELCLEKGADYYFSKPSSMKAYIEIGKKILEISEAKSGI